MGDAYKNGQRDAQIDALFQAVERIEAGQHKLREEVKTEIREQISPVRKAVLGDGKPHEGMAAIVAFHDKIIKWELGMIGSLFIGLIISLVTHW